MKFQARKEKKKNEREEKWYILDFRFIVPSRTARHMFVQVRIFVECKYPGEVEVSIHFVIRQL